MNDETAKDSETKPTGDALAVALEYQPERDGAPRVVAKGQGWLARQIIEIAEANGIEVREDADLAQLLSTIDVDSEIPLEAFTAVAEILSYVYRANQDWPSGVTPERPQDTEPDTGDDGS